GREVLRQGLAQPLGHREQFALAVGCHFPGGSQPGHAAKRGRKPGPPATAHAVAPASPSRQAEHRQEALCGRPGPRFPRRNPPGRWYLREAVMRRPCLSQLFNAPPVTLTAGGKLKWKPEDPQNRGMPSKEEQAFI